MSKVIIAGSRSLSPTPEEITRFLEKVNVTPTEVVSGGARGVDRAGEVFADTEWLPIKLFPALWDEYGKSAGYRRNVEMAKYADVLVCYWDGKSRGSKHMIDIAKKEGLEVYVECQ